MMSSKSFIFNPTIKGSTLLSIWFQPGTAVEQPPLSNCWKEKKMEELEVLKLLFISAAVQEEIKVEKNVFTDKLERKSSKSSNQILFIELLMQIKVLLGVLWNS